MSEKEPKSKKKILFVDSEVNALLGLKRMLRPLGNEWSMAFVENGQAALDSLAKEPFDVIVTDIRMPGMNGIQLLDNVAKHYPQMIRIILSGESEQKLLLNSVRISHQFLTKPCHPETLKSAISRTHMVFNLIQDDFIKRVVSRMKMLPSMPTLYSEIVKELEAPDSSMHKVGSIIAKDLAMSAKILQVVNSSFFGFSRHISSPAQAATLLGLDTIKSLVFTIQVFSQFDAKHLPSDFLTQLSEHCMMTGLFAKTVAEKKSLDKISIDHAYMAGLMHDVGKLVLAVNFPKQFEKVLVTVKNEGVPFSDGERKVFGIAHSEVGAYLMGVWGLPMPIVEAIAYHHSPSCCEHKQISPLTALHIANVMINQATADNGEDNGYRFDADYLAALNLGVEFSEWQKIYESFIR